MRDDIRGLGDGYYAYIKNKYTQDEDCVEYTHIGFIKGFEKVYGRKDKAFILIKVNEYISSGFGRIANRFIFQINHYA